MDTPISVIILSWNRPRNIHRIIDVQCRYGVIDEIIVFNNHREVHFEHRHPKVHVLNSNHDFTLRSRWCAATLARNERVFLQDDDLIVSESGYEQLVDLLEEDPQRLYGIEGRRPHKENAYNVIPVYGDVPILLTHCVGFTRDLIPYVLECEQAFLKTFGWLPRNNGEDIFLSYCAMSLFDKSNFALRVDTISLRSTDAISRRPDHTSTRTKVMRCCQTLFAKPLFSE